MLYLLGGRMSQGYAKTENCTVVSWESTDRGLEESTPCFFVFLVGQYKARVPREGEGASPEP